MNRPLSERTNHRSENSIFFSAENPANFQIPSVFTIEKNLRVLFLCFFQNLFRSIWKLRKTLQKLYFSSFTKLSPKSKTAVRKTAVFDSSCYNKHCFFGKYLFGNFVFVHNVFNRSTVFFGYIPDFFTFFRKTKEHSRISVLNFLFQIY